MGRERLEHTEILDRFLGEVVPRRFTHLSLTEANEETKVANLKLVADAIVGHTPDKVDLTFPKEDFHFAQDNVGNLVMRTPAGKSFPFTRWGLLQTCTRLDVPADYVKRCIAHDLSDVAAHNLNTWVPKLRGDLLFRTVSGRIRATLSDRYAVFDNEEVLDVLESVFPSGQYGVQSFVVDGEDMTLRIVSNEMLRIDGEDLFAGLQITNSEVGRGCVALEMFLFKYACTNGMLFGKVGVTSYSRRHIGSVSVVDEVTRILGEFPAGVEQIKTAVESARRVKMSTDLLHTLTEEFRKDARADDSLIDTVTGVMVNKYSPTVWGFANALTEVAQEFVEQRQMELERYAAHLVTSCVA
jgi:hypothetical protein